MQIISRIFGGFSSYVCLTGQRSITFSELGRENLWQLFSTWTDVQARTKAAWIEMKQGPRAEEIHFLLRRLWKMRAQMCPDVYFGDNNSSAQRRVIGPFFLSAYLAQTFTDWNQHGSLKLMSVKCSLSLIAVFHSRWFFASSESD